MRTLMLAMLFCAWGAQASPVTLVSGTISYGYDFPDGWGSVQLFGNGLYAQGEEDLPGFNSCIQDCSFFFSSQVGGAGIGSANSVAGFDLQFSPTDGYYSGTLTLLNASFQPFASAAIAGSLIAVNQTIPENKQLGAYETDFVFAAAVPEPSSGVLACVGLLAATLCRKIRRS